MPVYQTHGVLPQMIKIVQDYLNEEKLELREDSFFAEELRCISIPKRREMIRTYLCDNTFLLLQGIIDQVHSLGLMLSVPTPAVVAISPFVLIRTMLEYSSKLTYLTDPHASQRIPRTLKCLYADIQEFRKLPRDLTTPDGRRFVDERAVLATEWYGEFTNDEEKLRPVSALEITTELAGEQSDEWGKLDWVEDGRGNLVPFAYAKGYRINSAVAHGNSWAMQHYGMTKIRSDDGKTTARPGLDAKTVYTLQVLAGRQLLLSFGFAVQFMRGLLPSGTMNELEALLASLQEAP